MFSRWRQKLAQWLAPRPPAAPPRMLRMYAGAKVSRLTAGWGQSNTSEDAELAMSLRTLRARSRELVRDAAYAKRAKIIVQNNVVGTGIGLQAQVQTARGTLNDRVNDEIEAVWEEWCRAQHCHTGRSLHFNDLERQAIGQVFEAGEIFLRRYDRGLGESPVPLALEIIEPERLADEFQPSPVALGARVRLGVEQDSFYAPVAYWIRTLHPGEIRLTAEQSSEVMRVPEDQIIHLRIVERWPQTRGVPWLHAAARKLNDMDGLTEAEITAARGAACYMATIEVPNKDTPFGEPTPSGETQLTLEPAVVEKLGPGEKLNMIMPNRPNTQLDPFMRLMLREVAAGIGASYESLSRDYSQSNYSSSRLALLDDRDLWRTLQMWFIRAFREPLHRRWLQQAVLARAITSISIEEYAANPRKFEAVRFKPRGWSWIDPTKEVEAYKQAVRNGFTTVSHVIAMTGSGADLEDVLNERRRELDMMEEKELVFDTDPSVQASGAPAKPAEAPPPANESDDEPADEEPPVDRTVAAAEAMIPRGRGNR